VSASANNKACIAGVDREVVGEVKQARKKGQNFSPTPLYFQPRSFTPSPCFTPAMQAIIKSNLN